MQNSESEITMSESLHELSRRELIRGAGVFAGVAALGAMGAPDAAASDAPASAASATTILASANHGVVETNAGKVRGFTRNGIVTFKGIPYGATVAGAARFVPPTKPTPWPAVRSSMQFGPVCPQEPRTGWGIDQLAWLFDWNDGVPGEDCLRANVWTPGINDNKKRPVMVWLHGGGFQAGSGQELPSYDGENLARRGDVIVVTLNHRLGVLAHLNLASVGGEKYASSANVGMLDLVLALEWVRDNIANFGGDPGNVTIFGQSGGGGKVNCLMAMPAAKGLFHKAIVQSGSILRMASPERSEKIATSFLAELNLSANQIDQLHTLPVEVLVKAGMAAQRKNTPPTSATMDIKNFGDRMGWAPVMDGHVLPRHPFDPDAPAQSASVPMIIGCTLNEFTSGLSNPAADTMTDADLVKRVSGMYGEKADAIVAAFRAANPKAKPFDLFSEISTAPVRQASVSQAERKAAQGAAPAYLYWFTWQTPVLDGKPGAFHCMELPFVFDNIDRCANMTGGGAEARALAARASDAWIAFARTGDPNHAGFPKWDAFSAEKCPTMIFDNTSETKINPDTAARKAIFG